ncbi:MAG: hypothetical protein ACQESR_07380 [Planctomycetota bacterium]
MSRATFFLRECSTCGRRLRIRVEYLGRVLRCRHCGAMFEADDPSYPEPTAAHAGISLLERADQLLDSFDTKRQRPR